jgi:RES domain-containing protein
MRLLNCRKLTLSPVSSTWYRAILLKHLTDPLETSHTSRLKTRFNPGDAAAVPFETLYLAENQTTALYEVRALFGLPIHPVPNPHETKHIAVGIEVKLLAVADLTDPTQLKLLGVTAQELTGNWNTYDRGDAPTQQLGAALFATAGIEGFIAMSAPAPPNRNLVVFPQRLQKGSELAFEDHAGKVHRIVSQIR